MVLKSMLRTLTDIVFFCVAGTMIAMHIFEGYISSELTQESAWVLFFLFSVGVFTSLVLSFASAKILGNSRFRWYIAISGYEAGMVTLLLLL